MRSFARGAIAILLVSSLVPGTARAISFHDLLGFPPPDSVVVKPVEGAALDSLDVGAGADRGRWDPAEQVLRLPLGDAARTGVEGIVRPVTLGSPGPGRLAATIDGFPIHEGVIHWDDVAWFPTRGISRYEIDGGAAALLSGESAGESVALRTFAGPERPASIVAIDGGSAGARLYELDFARKFGKVGFHADVADFGHDGWGVIGRSDASHGFGRLDIPIGSIASTLLFGLASGTTEAGGIVIPSGSEMTDEMFLGLHLAHGKPTDGVELRLMRESSGLELDSLTGSGFHLTRERWWGELRGTRPLGRGSFTGALFGSNETRHGVLESNASWNGGGALVALSQPLGATRLDLLLRGRSQEPVGFLLEPALTWSDPSRRWWIEASQGGSIPAMLRHVEQPLPDSDRTAALLTRLESLDDPERNSRVAVGLQRGREGHGFAGGVQVAGVHSDGLQPWLAMAGSTDLPAAADDVWSGDARAFLRYAPANDFEVGLLGGGATFQGERWPYRPRYEARGWIHLRRVYFQGDLDLSGELIGRLLGPRRDPDQVEYPTVLTGEAILTARVKTLTLFLRLMNLGGNYVESDFRDGGPVPLPGFETRLGATLALLD